MIIFIPIVIVSVLILCFFLYSGRAILAASYLSKEFGVPVEIKSLKLANRISNITNLWMGTPHFSKTSTSFKCENTEINASFKELIGTPLTVENILMENIFVGIEVYGKNDNNWSRMLSHDTNHGKGLRDYVIHKLTIRNLTVELMTENGKVKRYPTIDQMEFYNITNETGFPVSEIEKAIFNLVMKEVFRKLGLGQLLDMVPGGSPLQYVPFLN